MDALTSSCFKKSIANSCCCSCTSKRASFSRATLGLGNPHEILFVRSQPPKLHSSFSTSRPSVLLQNKTIRSSSSVSSPPLAADAETLLETQTQFTCQESKTVHVTFKLERACQFGEKFSLVGGDLILGSWDPEHALLLDWSEGHVWTIGLDIPVGKMIQFKFILRGINGGIVWQPGPDRSFQAWKTENAIVVTEDWDSAESQKITEEATDNLIVESASNSAEELEVNLRDESMTNLTDESNLSEHVVGSNCRSVPKEDLTSTNDDDTAHIYEIPTCFGPPVLVPGLSPIPDPKLLTEETVLNEGPNGMVVDASVVVDEATNSDSLKDIPVGKTIHFKFILRGINGGIVWQPGPDRSFQAWKTENAIVVTEDWDSPESQKITEEATDSLIVESASNSAEELEVNLRDESMTNLTNESNLSEHVVGSNCRSVHKEDLTSTNDDDTAHSYEIPTSFGPPVLVPGLSPIPDPKLLTEETVLNEGPNGMVVDASVVVDEATNSDLLKQNQLSRKQEYKTSNANICKEANLTTDSTVVEEKSSDVVQEEMEANETEGSGSEEPNLRPAAGSVLTNDIHWAAKTLQKLILNLGFLKNQQLS